MLETAAARISIATMEAAMGLGKGALLWLLGIPIPIIILLPELADYGRAAIRRRSRCWTSFAHA